MSHYGEKTKQTTNLWLKKVPTQQQLLPSPPALSVYKLTGQSFHHHFTTYSRDASCNLQTLQMAAGQTDPYKHFKRTLCNPASSRIHRPPEDKMHSLLLIEQVDEGPSNGMDGWIDAGVQEKKH